jgi:ubiquinone/menaquinone biosynthesis C-methylase UbiE
VEHSERNYLPAAGRHWMLPLYDTFVWIVGGNASRRKLIQQAGIEAGSRVLEIGCGTGSIPVQIKQAYPAADVVGLDPDPRALEIARRKAERAGLKIDLDQGFSDHLPYADASFDRVFSSFMIHHLQPAARSATLAAIRRVLKPGGSFHLLDFVPARTPVAKTLGHLFHGPAHAHVESDFISLLRQAGFVDARELEDGSTLVGSIAYFRAQNP